MDYTREQPKEISLPPRLPLIGIINDRPADFDRGSKLVNGYIEQTDDGEIHVVKRPGLRLKYSFGAGLRGAGMREGYSFWIGGIVDGYEYLVYNQSTFAFTLESSPGSVSSDSLVYSRFVSLNEDGRTLFVHNSRRIAIYDSSLGLRRISFAETALGPFTFSVTHNDETITSAVSRDIGVYSSVTGTEIPAGTTIVSFNPLRTSFEMSAQATATNATASLSFVAAGPDGRSATYFGTPVPQALIPGVVDLNAMAIVAGVGGKVCSSDRGQPLNWNPLSFIRAYADQSQPIAVARHGSYVVLFKFHITEVFRDAGLTPQPLSRQDGMKLDVGCRQGNTVAEKDGRLFWVSNTESGLVSVWMMEGGRAREIATPAVRRQLRPATPDFAIAFSISGHTFYVITNVSPTTGYSLVYDATANFWCYWQAFGENHWPFIAADESTGETRFQHRNNGCVYVMADDITTDDNLEFDMDIYPPEFDANSRNIKYLSKMYIVGDQEEGSILKLRVNDSNRDPLEWTEFREFELWRERPEIGECGSFYRRAFHFQHSSPTRCRLRSVELDLQMGVL